MSSASAALPRSRPAPNGPLQNLFARERIDLSGTWRFLLDPMERGLRQNYPRETLPRDERAEAAGPLIEYSWDDSPAIRVPGDWNTQADLWFWYEGLAWYRRRFPAPAAAATGRWFLYFEGANYRSHVHLNGELLGRHEGGFTPFCFEVTGRLRDDNSLVVGVSNRREFGNVPGSDPDWFNYGGITRPVWLVHVPETFVREFRVDFHDAPAESITVRVQLDGAAADGAAVEIEIAALGLKAEAVADATGVAVATLTPRTPVPRWSPEAPRRFTVRVATTQDQVSDEIGFRTIATRGADILLNGRSTFLRGISLHEENLGVGSRCVDAREARKLLELARELGCNFVRLAHYPHGEATVRLADELGLLVWSEIPVYQNDIPFGDPETLARVRAMQATNITRDYNRACVVLWSVANETPITAERNHFLATLAGDARRLGGNRLVTAALDRSSSAGPDEIVIDDPLGEHLDVLAFNTYIGWYGEGTPALIAKKRWRSPYQKPLLFSEFGAEAMAGHHGPREHRWTEEHQAWFYEETIASAERIPIFRGMSPWILKDFRSPRRYHGVFQNYWNRKGLVSDHGQRKLAWETLRAYYAKRAL